MTRVSTFCAILLICLGLLPARADEPVRMRSDGRIVDASGNIIAIPNVADPRNTEYDKYYSKVGAGGKPGTTSDFYVNADADSGFVKKEIAPVTAKPATAMPDTPPETSPEQKDNALPANPSASTIQLNKYPGQPIYDTLPDSGTVYGN